MSDRRKPTRRDLLVVIGRLQHLFGCVSGAMNDRNPNRSAQVHAICEHGAELATLAQSFDDQTSGGPWADVTGTDEAWKKAV